MSRKTSNAVEILKHISSGDPEIERYVDEAHIESLIAQQVYDARMDAGLSQQELAELIGADASAIAQLEDADLEDDSFLLLKQIAKALNRAIDIRLMPTN